MSSDAGVLASPSSASDVEFRNTADDAWYSVCTVLNGDKLTVKYLHFCKEDDTVFEPECFKSLAELEEFRDRFRRVSAQVQDHECNKVVEGVAVCAAHSFSDFDVRFYDAVVDDVIHREHAFTNGEEECLCTFMIVWNHGPLAGCLTKKRIENLCLVQHDVCVDSTVALFFNIANEKLQSASQTPRLPSTTVMKPKPTFAQVTRCARQASPSQGLYKLNGEAKKSSNHNERTTEDIDIGGGGKHFVLLVDNMDKDLSPATIKEFIYRETSAALHVCVFPSLLSETYTKAALVFDCQKNFEKVWKFLENPNDIVISTQGRPWVVTEKFAGNDMLIRLTGNSMFKYQDKFQLRSIGSSQSLKVVHSGSEEYRSAKQLRDLYVEFVEHQKRLHKRLAEEERKIMQSAHLA